MIQLAWSKKPENIQHRCCRFLHMAISAYTYIFHSYSCPTLFSSKVPFLLFIFLLWKNENERNTSVSFVKHAVQTDIWLYFFFLFRCVLFSSKPEINIRNWISTDPSVSAEAAKAGCYLRLLSRSFSSVFIKMLRISSFLRTRLRTFGWATSLVYRFPQFDGKEFFCFLIRKYFFLCLQLDWCIINEDLCR